MRMFFLFISTLHSKEVSGHREDKLIEAVSRSFLSLCPHPMIYFAFNYRELAKELEPPNFRLVVKRTSTEPSPLVNYKLCLVGLILIIFSKSFKFEDENLIVDQPIKSIKWVKSNQSNQIKYESPPEFQENLWILRYVKIQSLW